MICRRSLKREPVRTSFLIGSLVILCLLGAGARGGPFAKQAAEIEVCDNLAAIKAAGAAALPDLLAAAQTSHRLDLIALALGCTGGPQALDTLRNLAAHPDAEVRANAAWALGHLNAQAAGATLAKLAGDASPFVRQAAVGSLAVLRTPESVDACVRALSDSDPDVRRVATLATGRSGRKTSYKYLVRFLEYELVEIETEPGDTRGEAEPGPLEPKWREPDPTLRYHAIRALDALRCIDAVPALIRAMERENSYNRLACAQAILNVGEDVAGVCLGRIVPLSYEPKAIERTWPEAINNGTLAVIAGKLGDERCVEHLRNTLRLPMRGLGPDKDLTELVIESVRLIGKYKVERESKRLAKMLKDCRLEQLGDALTDALDQIGPGAARHLARNLDDWRTSPFIMELLRREAFWTDEARDHLVAYLTHESDDVRRAATETFGLYLAKRVIEIFDFPLLKAQLLDPDPIVRAAAKKWLKQIGDVE